MQRLIVQSSSKLCLNHEKNDHYLPLCSFQLRYKMPTFHVISFVIIKHKHSSFWQKQGFFWWQWPLPPKLISASQQTFLPYVIKFPPGVPDILGTREHTTWKSAVARAEAEQGLAQPYTRALQNYWTALHKKGKFPIYVNHLSVILHAHSSSALAGLLHFHWQCKSHEA